jgi:hypothetical protein
MWLCWKFAVKSLAIVYGRNDLVGAVAESSSGDTNVMAEFNAGATSQPFYGTMQCNFSCDHTYFAWRMFVNFSNMGICVGAQFHE